MTPSHPAFTSRTLRLHGRDGAPDGTGAGAASPRGHAAAVRRVVVAQPAGRATTVNLNSPTCQGASRVAVADTGVARDAPVTGDGSVTSDALLRGAKVVRILHNGESYQLRATRHGKLILTK